MTPTRKRRRHTQPRPPLAPHTPELLQHHDVIAPGVRRRDGRLTAAYARLTRLDALLDSGAIDTAAWEAGQRYAKDVEQGEHGANGSSGVGTGSSDLGPEDYRLAALRRLGAARAALTGAQRTVMDRVAEDASWVDCGAALGIRDETARAWAIKTLAILADFYDGLSRRKANK